MVDRDRPPVPFGVVECECQRMILNARIFHDFILFLVALRQGSRRDGMYRRPVSHAEGFIEGNNSKLCLPQSARDDSNDVHHGNHVLRLHLGRGSWCVLCVLRSMEEMTCTSACGVAMDLTKAVRSVSIYVGN